MKANKREVLTMCIELGLETGYNRAHKHNDAPSRDVIFAAQENAIWELIYIYFSFKEPQGE